MLNFGASKPRVKGGAGPGLPPWTRACPMYARVGKSWLRGIIYAEMIVPS